MTLYSMALNNIKKNFKNYWAFFLSSTFSVFVLYLFLSISNSSSVKSQLGSMHRFVFNIFMPGSCLTAFFSVFFIWYSNTFFIKSRKKEFATYMLLGMTKKQTARLNLIENIIVMGFAFCAGILLGFIFNKYLVMIMFSLMGISGNAKLEFSTIAVEYCFIVFGIVFILINLHGSSLIYKDNLIDLFNSSKKAERGLKVSFFTVILGFLSLAFLGYGYYLAIKKLSTNINLSPQIILFVVLGTVLLISSIVSLLIYLSKKNEKKLFKGTRLISTSQLFYRYRGNVGTLSVIAVTTTVALCAVLFCVGLFDQTEQNSRYIRPFSLEYLNGNSASDKIVESTLSSHKELSIKYRDSFELLKAADGMSGSQASAGSTSDNNNLYIINESEFNKINRHENIDRKVSLSNEDSCYYVQMQTYTPKGNVVGSDKKFYLNGKEYSLKVQGTDFKPFFALDRFKETLVVKDGLFKQMQSSLLSARLMDKYNIKITGYELNNDIISKSFDSDLKAKMPAQNKLLTFYENYSESLKLQGMMIFVGVFIGLLFLTATGSIIYFKMTMEAKEDKNKYRTLINIGVNKKEIKQAVSRELLVFFGLPLVVAIVNAYIASIPLSKLQAMKLTKEFILVAIVYALFYSIYYFITLNVYVKRATEN